METKRRVVFAVSPTLTREERPLNVKMSVTSTRPSVKMMLVAVDVPREQTMKRLVVQLTKVAEVLLVKN